MRNTTKALLILLPGLCLVPQVYAGCDHRFISPTDISWSCIYPISLGGRVIAGPGEASQEMSNPICYCPPDNSNLLPRAGISAEFWEPVRAIETVKTPFCFPTAGIDSGSDITSSGNPAMMGLSGTTENDATRHSKFQQAHYLFFALFDLMDIFMDVPCVSHEGYDVAWISEVDPSWNSDMVSLFLSPEALLFANPISALACMPDAAMSSLGMPLDPLFWCMGTWGSTYPLSGTISSGDDLAQSAGLAARAIFRMGRTGLLVDRGMDGCNARITPIWSKSHYKLQLMAPVAENRCHYIGESTLLWGAGKNPPGNGQDNFSWLKWRKTKCCMTIY